MEKGHGRDQPFSRGGAEYRAGPHAGADRGVPKRGEQGDGGGGDRYELIEVYESFAAEYGLGSPADIEARFTDEQFALYAQKAAKRKRQAAFAELDRIVTGTSWGVSIAFDRKKRTAHKWESVRRKAMRDTGPTSKGLTGAALEAAVMAIASADPSLVKIQEGAQ